MTMLGANQNQACAFGQLFFAIVVEIQTAPLQNDSEEWLSDKTRPCPSWRRGRRAKRPCFFRISTFLFPKTIINRSLLHRPSREQ
jgi:hypothetical protein